MSQSMKSPLPAVIDDLWERRSGLSPEDTAARAEVVAAVDEIDAGNARVAFVDPATGEVVVDERAKHAILLAFRLLPMTQSQVGDFRHHDRMPLKTRLDGVRVVPGAIARWGSYIAPGAVLMPSFVNIGAYVDSGTMVDTWATVGSGAQIGKNVHLSGGVGIGGVLEPAEAVPGRGRGRVHDLLPLAWSSAAPGCATGAVLGVGRDPDQDHARDRREHRRGAAALARCPPGRCALTARGSAEVPRRRVRHARRAHAEAAHRGRAARQDRAQRHPAGPRRRRVRRTRSSPAVCRTYRVFRTRALTASGYR